MRFIDKRAEFQRTIETVCLFMSFLAVFFQIWVIMIAIDAYFKGNFHIVMPLFIISGLALLICVLGVYLTHMPFLKGITEGRTQSYQKTIN